jgi:hypothetical protein
MNPADPTKDSADLPDQFPPRLSKSPPPIPSSPEPTTVIDHPNMVNLAVELNNNTKLYGTNYLEWKIKMSAILQLKHLLKLVNGTKSAEEAKKQDKVNPDRYEDALAVLVLNCDSKISARFSHESKEDPKTFWKLLDKYYQPKTVQNQDTYLNQIFSTIISSTNLKTTLNLISDNC